jgi:hypothetical protein
MKMSPWRSCRAQMSWWPRVGARCQAHPAALRGAAERGGALFRAGARRLVVVTADRRLSDRLTRAIKAAVQHGSNTPDGMGQARHGLLHRQSAGTRQSDAKSRKKFIGLFNALSMRTRSASRGC